MALLQVDCKKEVEFRCTGEYKNEEGEKTNLNDTFAFNGKFIIKSS